MPVQTPIEKELQLIASYMRDVSNRDTKLAELLTLSVGRVLAKIARSGEDWKPHYEAADTNHIKDWLKAAIINDEPWLKHCDAKGRPRKLMKFSTLEHITQEADKAMMKANQKLQGVRLVEGDEELVAELEDGYYVVRLLTPAALDREGARMQHCIGQGAYDEELESGNSDFLSLRDPAGNPHATIELTVPETAVFHHFEISQIQGKQNTMPVTKYLKIMRPYLEKEITNFNECIANRGLVSAADGNLYTIKEIPENSTIHSLVFHNLQDIKLPRGLTVKNRFDIARSGIKELPDDIRLLGDVVLQNVRLSTLPENLNIGGSLYLSYTRNFTLPSGLKVNKDLLIEATEMETIPNDLIVGRDFFLRRNYNIKEVPEGIQVGNRMSIVRTFIDRLGDDLTIRGDLTLEELGSNFVGLPAGLVCHQKLNIIRTPLTELPADIIVKGRMTLPANMADKVLQYPENLSDDLVIDFGKNTPRKLGVLREEARSKKQDDTVQGMAP